MSIHDKYVQVIKIYMISNQVEVNLKIFDFRRSQIFTYICLCNFFIKWCSERFSYLLHLIFCQQIMSKWKILAQYLHETKVYRMRVIVSTSFTSKAKTNLCQTCANTTKSFFCGHH